MCINTCMGYLPLKNIHILLLRNSIESLSLVKIDLRNID